MQFVDFPTPNHVRTSFTRQAAFFALTSIALTAGTANAQSGTQTGGVPLQPTVHTSTTVHAGPQWQELSAAQKNILQPLAGTWNSLMPERKSKWLAMAQNYPGLAAAEQAKLQSRMVEWAALNPQERERARLNFAETKKLSPNERTADWEAYQALSPEQKQKLAEKAHPKPTGAAIAPKPVAPNTLTVVPLTRRTTEQNNPALAAKPTLDRHTLLPVAPRPAQGASTPATSASSTSHP
jgi:hypothetical protein